MARYVSLKSRADSMRWAAATVVIMTAFSGALRAQQTPMTPPPKPASGKTPATNAAPDSIGQYGKIVAPGDQAAHPLKLKLPFPDVGEVKIPSSDELVMRDKLEQLASLSDADIRMHLDHWPAFAKMSLRDQGSMLIRIQDFRDYRSNTAKMTAHDMGLLTLTPDQQAKFEKEYWAKRLQMESDLTKQFTPIYKASEQKMQDDLYREFSVMAPGPIVQAPKPGMAPVKTTASPLATNSVTMPIQPIAQAPK